MENKRNLAITSILIALIGLMITILGLSYVILTTPNDNANVENVMGPFNTQNPSEGYVNYEIYNIDEKQDTTNSDTANSSNPNAPVISNFPDPIEFDEDTPHTLNLDDYVTDTDNNLAQLTWTVSSTPDYIIANIDSTTHELTLSAPENWNGADQITLRVQDPDGNYDTVSTQIQVNPVDDPAVWKSLDPQPIKEDTAKGTVVYKDIMAKVTDIDNSEITIHVFLNQHFLLKTQGNDLVLDWIEPNWYGSETVTLEANDVPTSFELNVSPVDDKAVWNLSKKEININEDLKSDVNSQSGTQSNIIYANIYSAVSDIDGPKIERGDIHIISQPSSHYTLSIPREGNDLIITDLDENWYGNETVTLEANGVPTSFKLNVNQLLDECFSGGTGIVYLNPPICD